MAGTAKKFRVGIDSPDDNFDLLTTPTGVINAFTGSTSVSVGKNDTDGTFTIQSGTAYVNKLVVSTAKDDIGGYVSAIADTNGGLYLYKDTSSNNGVCLRTHPSANDWRLQFPENAGTSGQVLSTDGTGVTSWITPTGGGGGGISWSEVTGTTQTMAVDTAYIANNASQVVFTLPDTAAVGKVVRVSGKGAGGWKIAQNASEIIHFGNTDTTTGTGGYLSSTHRRDAVELVCVVADTEWNVISSVGNITVV
jgi:hypothetical protein